MCFLPYFRRLKLHKKLDPTVLLGEQPGVSIIKPLMGVDPFLESNLESHFLMNYPKVGHANLNQLYDLITCSLTSLLLGGKTICWVSGLSLSFYNSNMQVSDLIQLFLNHFLPLTHSLSLVLKKLYEENGYRLDV